VATVGGDSETVFSGLRAGTQSVLRAASPYSKTQKKEQKKPAQVAPVREGVTV